MENIESIIDRIIIERNKSVDSAVIMDIQKIAIENGIETKFILNERNIVNALKSKCDKNRFFGIMNYIFVRIAAEQNISNKEMPLMCIVDFAVNG